jgi:hypothetical protein
VKNFILGALAAIVVPAIVTFIYLRLGFASVVSDTKPPAWEARLMYNAVHASVSQLPKTAEPTVRH